MKTGYTEIGVVITLVTGNVIRGYFAEVKPEVKIVDKNVNVDNEISNTYFIYYSDTGLLEIEKYQCNRYEAHYIARKFKHLGYERVILSYDNQKTTISNW